MQKTQLQMLIYPPSVNYTLIIGQSKSDAFEIQVIYNDGISDLQTPPFVCNTTLN